MKSNQTKHLSPAMAALLAKLRAGWTAVIYLDDPRTRYLPPDRHPRGAERGHSATVLALAERGLARLVKATDGAAIYAAAAPVAQE